MFREHVTWWLSALGIAVIIVVVTYQRRWNRLFHGYRRLEEHADSLLQNGQGTILNVQGILYELSADDPIRQRIEHVLSHAERQLAEFREEMQPHCSEQQQDLIQ